MSTDYWNLGVAQTSALLNSGGLGAVELTQALLERAQQLDPQLNSFIRFEPERALEMARRAQQMIDQGRGGPLTGVPLGVKDNFCVPGSPTTCASPILDGFVPFYHSTVTQRLEDAGAVFLGRTNMDEFAMGSSTETSCFGPTRNPWDLERVPGGSSGGSAAAIAARLCPAALGTDTGGSVRQPAALCGIVGLKPTYGRVSRYGIVAYASSLDQAGVLTRSVRDAALMLQQIAGLDTRDATCADRPLPDLIAACDHDVRGLKIGVPEEYFVGGLDPQIEKLVREALDVLRGLGAEVLPVSLPHTQYAIAAYYIVAPAECSSNLARYDGMRYGLRCQDDDLRRTYMRSRSAGFGREVKRRIMLGTFALSSGYYDAYYGRAQRTRTLIRNDFLRAFEQVDLLATPTSPSTAFRIGERLDDPLTMYLSDVYTISVNLAGLPAISLPCGMAQGLPAGLQLIGRPFDEPTLLKVGDALESATQHHLGTPPMAQPNADAR
ncbi:MAG: Asp-tRNA(Asn)/Glu-tRNA(Gln) amidotransferase subunit GatA [Candidatus Alcyoniella australis]|nr:Asp-tRNA(Asn)/Glu-tRNA(Gln) amidotransferase subunit GatA [Candidatus Alcyoniella australis]